MHTLKKNYEGAIKEFERDVELNPGFVQIYHGIGFVHADGGNPEDSIPFFEKAMREYDKVVESAEDAISQPNAMDWLHFFRTSALGQQASPRTEVALRELLNYSPGLTCGEVRQRPYYTQKPEDLKLCISGLANAELAD